LRFQIPYYRLNGLAISLPPARERTDIDRLIANILAREVKSRGDGSSTLRLSDELSRAFHQYHWPGNLRQLSGMLRTACLMLDDDEGILGLDHLSEEALKELSAQPRTPTPEPGATTLRAHSHAMIVNAVAQAGGNVAAAARQLGISRNTLYRRLSAGETRLEHRLPRFTN